MTRSCWCGSSVKSCLKGLRVTGLAPSPARCHAWPLGLLRGDSRSAGGHRPLQREFHEPDLGVAGPPAVVASQQLAPPAVSAVAAGGGDALRRAGVVASPHAAQRRAVGVSRTLPAGLPAVWPGPVGERLTRCPRVPAGGGRSIDRESRRPLAAGPRVRPGPQSATPPAGAARPRVRTSRQPETPAFTGGDAGARPGRAGLLLRLPVQSLCGAAVPG